MKRKAVRDSEPAQPAELRRRAEEHLRTKEADRAEVRSVADARALVHELQVHQIELEMQNEELRRARMEAEEAKEKYLDLFDFAPTGHFVWDREGRSVELNLAGAALVRLERSVANGKRFGQFVAAKSRSAFAEFLARVLTIDAKQTCEVVMEREGSSVWVLVEGIAAQDRHGPERLCRATVIDISAQKRADELAAANQALEAEMAVRQRAQEAVRQKAEEFRAVLDAAPVAVWIAQDRECRVITGNAYADELIMGTARGGNISRSAAPGEAAVTYRVFREGVELEPEQLPAQRATATGGPVPAFDMELVFPDGRELCLRAGAIPLYDMKGEVRGAIVAGLDVTPLKRAEEALRISQERLNQAISVARLGTFEHDHVTGAVDYSPVMRELMGFDPEEKVTLAAIFDKILTEDREAMMEAVRGAHDPAGDGKFEVDHRVRNADERVRWISVRARTSFEGEGSERRPIRTIGAGLDITEQKEFQAELQRLVDERTARLQELVGELEHFSYTITHDLKAPLRAMKGFAEITRELCGDCARSEAKEAMARISTSAERMECLITDALNYSRAVRQELPLTDVDTGSLLQGMLDSYPEFQAWRAQIQVDGRLPVVLGNEAGLTQCFSNLLGNAVKFVKPGERPQIRMWAEERGGWARIWVEDKGIGISREMLPRVFEMFSRGGGGYEGTGIGLALVRKVTQRMGGGAGLESEEGKGSRFWIELKLGEARAQPPRAEVATAEPKGGTVLYVEDEESDAMFMQRAFGSKGLESALRVVGDGRAAIEYLSGAGKYADRREYPLPSVVLLDLNLPQVPGFEVLKWMRNHPDFARTPVVVFSSSTREDDRVKAKELGADEFVAKPSSGLKFGEVVEGLQHWAVRGRKMA